MAMFSNFLTNYTSGIRNKTINNNSYADIMSECQMVTSLNSSINHTRDGYIYLSNLLIQFSGSTNPAQVSTGSYQIYFPIASQPYVVYCTGVNGGSSPTVCTNRSTTTDASCSITISGNSGNFYWYSIGPAPTTPIYTNIINSGSILYLNAVAMDSTGKYQYCCGGASGQTGTINVNSTYGYGAWTQKKSLSNTNFSCIATNSSGQYVYAAVNGGGIYDSSNNGQTWNQTTAQSTIWSCITCNSLGNYIFAGVNGGSIWYSSDNGNTWNQSFAPTKTWFGIACDSTGQYVVACINSFSDGGIYTSNDYGVTWNSTSANQNLQYYSITSDSTGQYLAACVLNGNIYTSINSGSSWNPVQPNLNKAWNWITSNSTGQYLTAIASNQGIWYSKDYGTSWTNISNITVIAVDMNSNGNVATAVAAISTSGNPIYVSLNASN